MAEAGGGWMSDYDTIPLVISPGSMPEKFTSYQRHVPSLMAGTAQEWADLVMHMADVAETTAAGGVNPDGRQSDMLELYEVHERDKAQGKSHYASKYEVADFAQAFMAASMTDEEAARFCNKYKNKRALHVSHHSVSTEHLDSQKRDVYMRQARKTFHSACLADRSQVEANALAAHAAPAAPAVSTTSRFLQDFVDAKGIWPKVEERGLPSFFFDQQRAASGDILRKLLNSAVRGRAELSVYKACKSRSKGGVDSCRDGYVYSLPSDTVYSLYEGRLEWAATQFPELRNNSNAQLAAIAKEGKFSCMTNFRRPQERVEACLEERFPETARNKCYKQGNVAQLKEMLLAENANGHTCLNEPFRLLSGLQEASFKDAFRAEAEACVKHPAGPNMVNYTFRNTRPQPILEATFANSVKHMQKCVPFIQTTPFSFETTKPAFFFSRFPDFFPLDLMTNYTKAWKAFSLDSQSEKNRHAKMTREEQQQNSAAGAARCSNSWHREQLHVFNCYTALENVLFHAVLSKRDEVYQEWGEKDMASS